MLSFNDNIQVPDSTYTCDNCGDSIPSSLVHWYEAPQPPTAIGSHTYIWSDTSPVVPICSACHCNPTSWLPPAFSHSDSQASSYLSSRDCERLDGPRDWF